MDREAFEQLVSAWLDQPQRDDLRLQIEAAVAESRELARVRDEWLRLDRLVRSCLPGVDGIDWRRLQEHIAAALAPDAADTALDEQLRRFTDVGQRVDWPRLRQRISQAIGSSAEKPTVIRFPLRRAAASIVLAAAAAALLLVFILPAEPRTAPVSFAQARVVGGPQVSDAGRAFARVSVSAPPEATEEIKGEQPRERSYVEPRLAEVFLMVTPARPSGDNHGRINPFGFN
jgi:hypothetical protein